VGGRRNHPDELPDELASAPSLANSVRDGIGATLLGISTQVLVTQPQTFRVSFLGAVQGGVLASPSNRRLGLTCGAAQVKILLVDDHVLIREAMRGVLREIDPSATIMEAQTARQADDLVERDHDISLVLLDLRLPDRDGMEMLTALRASHPSTAVVMLSALSDRDTVLRSLTAGAQGFIAKTATRDILLGALRLIMAGGIYIPPEILGETAQASTPAPPEHAKPSPSDLGLTGRQLDVLALMMQGKSNKLICRHLDLAEPTVKNHVSSILKALNVNNRTEAVLAVTAFGWDLPSPTR
jgi:DNA-binding NarL/FixJ family response regulator